jgi:hypothetical protein
MPEMNPFPAGKIHIGPVNDATSGRVAAWDGGLDVARPPGLNVIPAILPPTVAQAVARGRVVRRVRVPNRGVIFGMAG